MPRIAALLVAALVCNNAYGIDVLGITSGNDIVTWNVENPQHLSSAQGLGYDKKFIGIATLHESGVGLRSVRRFSDFVAAEDFDSVTPGDTRVGNVMGTHFGVDISPVSRQLRVVSNTGDNFEMSPFVNAKTNLPDLTYLVSDVNAGREPNVVHLAFASSFPGSGSVELYGIDSGLDTLVRFVDVNGGELQTVGSLGIDVTVEGGFDYDERNGTAYAALTPANESQSSFYTIDLSTGKATKIGVIGGGVSIVAFAVPEPSALLLLVTGSLGLFLLRWQLPSRDKNEPNC